MQYNSLKEDSEFCDNKPIPKVDHYSCLGVNMDERMLSLSVLRLVLGYWCNEAT